MSEKKKKQPRRMGTLAFGLLWALIYGFAWSITTGSIFVIDDKVPQFFGLWSEIEIVYWFIWGAATALIAGVLHQILLRRQFGLHLRWWWLWSTLLSGIAGALVHSYFWNVSFNTWLGTTIILGIMFAIPTVIQAWMLRHNVEKSWRWILAGFFSGMVFGLSSAFLGYYLNFENLISLTFSIGGFLQGAVMALTLIWLFSMTRSEPLKRGMESAQDYDTNRLQTKIKQDNKNQYIIESEHVASETHNHER